MGGGGLNYNDYGGTSNKGLVGASHFCPLLLRRLVVGRFLLCPLFGESVIGFSNCCMNNSG